MRILVDILHPAHVHFFRNAIEIWRERGHEVLITSRDKDLAIQLLDNYGLEHTCISRQKSGLLGLFGELVGRNWRLYRIAREFNPDVLAGIAGISIAHVGRLIGRPSIVFYDTEFAKVSNTITYPFATTVCTPQCYQGEIGQKHVRYPGYHELAYLHPKRFEPNEARLKQFGVTSKNRYAIVRFVSWDASHDVGETGFTADDKVALVQSLQSHGTVLISSEADLPDNLRPYVLRGNPADIHHLMAFASLYIGESATMASESAVLGVPTIYLARSGRGYTDEQEKRYQLVYNFTDRQFNEAMERAEELMSDDAARSVWRERRNRMLEEKIDVTGWMTSFVERCGTQAK